MGWTIARFGCPCNLVLVSVISPSLWTLFNIFKLCRSGKENTFHPHCSFLSFVDCRGVKQGGLEIMFYFWKTDLKFIIYLDIELLRLFL